MQPNTLSHLLILSERFSMNAITFIGAISNAKMFGFVTHRDANFKSNAGETRIQRASQPIILSPLSGVQE